MHSRVVSLLALLAVFASNFMVVSALPWMINVDAARAGMKDHIGWKPRGCYMYCKLAEPGAAPLSASASVSITAPTPSATPALPPTDVDPSLVPPPADVDPAPAPADADPAPAPADADPAPAPADPETSPVEASETQTHAQTKTSAAFLTAHVPFAPMAALSAVAGVAFLVVL